MRMEENLPDIGTAACLVDGRQLVPEACYACLHEERINYVPDPDPL
jgi:hypothetical protein